MIILGLLIMMIEDRFDQVGQKFELMILLISLTPG